MTQKAGGGAIFRPAAEPVWTVWQRSSLIATIAFNCVYCGWLQVIGLVALIAAGFGWLRLVAAYCDIAARPIGRSN